MFGGLGNSCWQFGGRSCRLSDRSRWSDHRKHHLATNATGPITRDTILATSTSGPVIEDIASMTVAYSPVTNATVWTTGFDG